MKERISALVDGQLDDVQGGRTAIGSIAQSPDGRATWNVYCTIGDALRDEHALGADLTAAVMGRLEGEPTVLSPVTAVRERQRTQGLWNRALPLAASVMGVAAVGWVALQTNAPAQAPIVAKTTIAPAAVQTVSTTTEAERRAARDTALRAFVLAHQGTARGTLPGVAPYVRTVAEMPQASQ